MSIAEQKEVFQTILVGIPDDATRNGLSAEFDELEQKHSSAAGTEKAPIEARLIQLGKDAAITAQGSAQRTESYNALIILIVFLCFGSVWAYFAGIGAERYTVIEATRPILVFTLIIAMLGFGGALIFRALFTNETPSQFQDRFRLAREVFLVYSGIFGTIIGFYFGAASGEAAAKPPSLAIPSIQSDGLVTAKIEGGSSPFTGTIKLMGKDELSLVAAGDKLSIQLTPDKDCPAGAKIMVKDSNSRAADRTITQTATELVSLGWKGCAGQATEGAGGTGNVANNSTVVAVDGTNANNQQ